MNQIEYYSYRRTGGPDTYVLPYKLLTETLTPCTCQQTLRHSLSSRDWWSSSGGTRFRTNWGACAVASAAAQTRPSQPLPRSQPRMCPSSTLGRCGTIGHITLSRTWTIDEAYGERKPQIKNTHRVHTGFNLAAIVKGREGAVGSWFFVFYSDHTQTVRLCGKRPYLWLPLASSSTISYSQIPMAP